MKEAPGIQVQLYSQTPTRTQPYPIRTTGIAVLRTMFGGMLTQRLDEIRQKADAPFIFAGARYGSLVKGLEFFTTSGVVGPGKAKAGLQFPFFGRKPAHCGQHGFTESELERVKRSLLNSAERSFKEMDKAESRSLVGEVCLTFP